SPTAPFFLVGALCIVNAVLVWTSLPESLPVERRTQQGQSLPLSALPRHADGPVYFTVAASYLVCLTAFSIMTAVFSLFFFFFYGMDEQHVGYVMAAIGVVGVVMQGGVIRRLLPKHGEIPLARAGMAILLVSFILLPVEGGLYGLYFVSCLIAVGNSLVQPTLNGLASRCVTNAWQGRAMGLLQSSASLGRTIGPVLGGWLLGFDRGTEHYGRTPFWVAAAFMAVTMVIAARLRDPKCPQEAPEETPG
ncbi:MAG: MFS transporter, partial [Verrucomicrobium sp.]